jgi:hypothetical protein
MQKAPTELRRIRAVLTLPRGRKVTVTAEACSADEEVPFKYEGDTSVFRPFAPSGRLGFFTWYLEGIAANLGADVEFFEEQVRP